MSLARARRELAVSLALVALGGALVLAAAGRPWTEQVVRAAGVPAVRSLRTGTDVALAAPLGLLCLAGVVGVLAARGWVRRVVAALVLAAGGTVGVLTAAFLAGASSTAGDRRLAWPAVAVVGAALTVAGAALAVVRGGRWPGMSGRYERKATQTTAPTAPAAASTAVRPQGLWDALDAGVDPTDQGRSAPPAR